MVDRIKELMLMAGSEKSVLDFLNVYGDSDHHFIELFPATNPNAIIAFKKQNCIIEILNIAVDPDYRGRGFGSQLVKQVIAAHSPAKIIAETDDDAVDFYRKLGFNTIPFHSKWGITRYKMLLIFT
jgi:ribosomal protein S18 acetylase RimI-like enzyme